MRRRTSVPILALLLLALPATAGLLFAANEAAAGVLLSSPTSFGVRDAPVFLALADLNGDTVPDAVTPNVGTWDVSVLLGNGDGTFQAAVSFRVGDFPVSVAVGDLDGDTVPDLVTANTVSRDASVLLGNGDGTFQRAYSVAADVHPRFVAVADLDGDTVPDLAAPQAATLDPSMSVLLGNGDATFQAALSFAVDHPAEFVAVADLEDLSRVSWKKEWRNLPS